MTKPTLLMTTGMLDALKVPLEDDFEVHRIFKASDPEAMLQEIRPSVEAICSGGHGFVVSRDVIAKLPKLKIIANFGVGYDGVDTAAAAERGIVVTNTPDVLNEEVADTALGLLLMTVRELSEAERYLRAGEWGRKGDYRLTPLSLRDRSVGIAGLGRIGKAIAKRCAAFGLPISYFGRSEQGGVAYKFYDDLEAMARDVDTLIVVTPATPETRNMVNADVLAALGERGILINIARGAVVDEPALIAAVKAGTIHGAGLDVMWDEPKINPELMELPNTVLLPHVGSASQHTRVGMANLVKDNLVAYTTGKPPLTPVPETPFSGW
jgi:lactate dehydrogenase-like 2-hydroxyacid dehydrogenase